MNSPQSKRDFVTPSDKIKSRADILDVIFSGSVDHHSKK